MTRTEVSEVSELSQVSQVSGVSDSGSGSGIANTTIKCQEGQTKFVRTVMTLWNSFKTSSMKK